MVRSTHSMSSDVVQEVWYYQAHVCKRYIGVVSRIGR